MQRFLLSLLMIVTVNGLFAQSIEDIEKQFQAGQLAKAKASVDAYLAKEKNQTKSDGWWYKGVIYNEIAKNDSLSNSVNLKDGRIEAFEAFKKYYELDSKALRATLEQHVRLFDIYNGYFENAVTSFNSSKFEDAYNNFKNALTIEEYISGKDLEYNGFKFPVFDTTLVQNIALSAYRAKKEDDAVIYWKKIADQRIAAKENVDVYQLLVEYYSKKNDNANKEKYLQIGRELYPTEDRWYQLELEEVDTKDKTALFKKYEELLPKYPGKFVLSYNYAVELYNYIYAGDSKPADAAAAMEKLENALKQTLATKSDYPEADVLMSRHLYNLMFDTQDEQRAIKGNTPADQKKRADLKAKMMETADKMIPYAEAAYNIYSSKAALRPIEKGNYKMATDFLVTAYEMKGDKAKAEEYKKKLDSIN